MEIAETVRKLINKTAVVPSSLKAQSFRMLLAMSTIIHNKIDVLVCTYVSIKLS